MTTKETNLQEIRENYIIELDKAGYDIEKKKQILADDLFTLDLTVYSQSYSFDSALYNALAMSVLDNDISLHPEQIKIIEEIENNAAVIVSAPTSFGKTFCIFEYIARVQPQNIVLIVPTLALIDEYVKKIIKKYNDFFAKYKIYTNINEDRNYDFGKNNLFILTHDRVVNETLYNKIEKIDFLVIDEVYKLEEDQTQDRVLILNMAYYYLSQKAKKYVLLAPFIQAVLDVEKLEKSPIFINSNYSPVVNQVEKIAVNNDSERFLSCNKLLNEVIDKNDKTLVYFPTVDGLYKYINTIIINEPLIESLPQHAKGFLDWARDEIHEEWAVVKAIERGYLVHNGQIPIGTRLFQLDCFENDSIYNKLLCTSTLLEGVNTTSKNIIITKPSRNSNNSQDKFSAFDFFNLVGRTGRLNQHLLGKAYYIKSPNDIDYKKIDALKSIRFEITTNSQDINIQKESIENNQEVKNFLKLLKINIATYKSYIGSKFRFENVVSLYDRYKENQENLINILKTLKENPQAGRYQLILILHKIISGTNNSFDATLINQLLNKKRHKLKTIINKTLEHSKRTIDSIISSIIRFKYSYIEHSFYNGVSVIRFFLENDHVCEEFIEILDKKILDPIDYLYFSAKKQKKMLTDLGIYERDVDDIIKIIGENYDDIHTLKELLLQYSSSLKNLSYISRYVINNL